VCRDFTHYLHRVLQCKWSHFTFHSKPTNHVPGTHTNIWRVKVNTTRRKTNNFTGFHKHTSTPYDLDICKY
jgi:hypothetical protein